MSIKQFTRLIRFIGIDGKIHYGDAILPHNSFDARLSKQARLIKGSVLSGEYTVTDSILDIKKLLSPLSSNEIPTVRCIGLNYLKHAIETNFPIPKYPVLFYKPSTSVGGPIDPIMVPSSCQVPNIPVNSLDYECELVVVIGKKGKNISIANAFNHILGYTVGNDVSHREWQTRTSQFNLGKMYDGWAPIGPTIVNRNEFTPEQVAQLRQKSFVNGEIRQNETTADLIFGVPYIVSFLSQGTTLLPGDLIFMGTPNGVAMGMKPQPKWVNNGDELLMEIEGIGSIINKVTYDALEKSKL
ncbi:fumarylacetoacetate hydrolase family protein [Nadsonia fulvescens var. elongata DSM 6958]|uniref:Fumarylacetoacetate hydrolase family protein n=1 Tax=Nadsonia fulvescens var. elongata DSM 6958 TaxID=857566 RepID=A0A1E3PP40_9ASCO|nr:fumarylacetoacetate hydrolase family protein [Nadsonia fulvescens var. elongata DSM 6958]